MGTKGFVAVSALALAALAAAPATGALDATKPVPPCTGQQITDRPGDQVFAVPVAGGVTAGPDNTDLRAGFFKFVDDALTANIQVANLTQDIPTGATGVGWYFEWTVGSEIDYVKAEVDITGGLRFAYGTFDPMTSIYSDTADTQGKLFEGPDGIIQLAVPAGIGGSEGKILKSPHITVFDEYNVPMVGGALATADDGGGASYTVAPCGGEATPGGGETPPAGGGSTTAPAALPVSASPRTVSAKKASKKKSVSFTLTAKETITRVGLRLYSGKSTKPAVYSTATVSKLSGKRTVKMKLRRKLKPGRYTLDIVGTNAQGQRAAVAIKIKVKK